MMRLPARAAAVAALVAVFGVGVLAGLALHTVVDELDPFEHLTDADEDLEEEEPLLAALDLSQSQRERIEDLLDEREDVIEDYWEGRLPEVTAIIDASRAEIRAVLDPRQRVEFDRRLERLRAHAPERARD